MKRFDHMLKPNKRRTVPQYWVFFDTENEVIEDSYEIRMPFKFGLAEYAKWDKETKAFKVLDSLFFTEAEEFISFLEKHTRKQTTLHVIAHNVTHDICTLDLLRQLSAKGWEIVSIYEQQRTIVIRLRKETKRIVIVDTLNWFRGKLEDLAPLVGEEKVKVDFTNTDDALLRERVKSDVRIIRKLVEQYINFVQENDLGDFKLTAASQAFTAFRHRFMNTRIYIHNNETVLRLERAAYKGGMVRCWRVGEFHGEFYQLDVNSMYPFVMKLFEYPTKLICYRENVTPEELYRLVSKFCVIADLTVNPQTPRFIHRTKQKKIVYPLYRFRDVFTTPEVIALLRENAIEKVHRVAIYKKATIFAEFVDALYLLRLGFKKAGNKAYDFLCKVMMNSLYGKFGAMSRKIEPRPDLKWEGIRLNYEIDPDIHECHGVYYFSYDPNATPYVEVVEGEAFNSFPAIAAHVTAYARMYLYTLAEVAGLANVYYCDTDSLIVNREGYENLQNFLSPVVLGALKEEYKADYLRICSRKDYQIGEKRVLKGIPEVARVYDTNETYKEMWPTLRGFHNTPEKRDYVIRKVKVNLKRQVYDGLVTHDGTVIPFIVPMSFDPNPLADPLE